MITQHFILHIVPDEIRPRIYLSQRNTGLQKLQFTMVGTNGAYYSIPANTSVTLVGSKPDRKQFSYACTYSGNTVSCDVTDQMTAVAGIVTAELRFANTSGQVLPSQNMELIVERSPLDGMVCSRNDFKSTDDEIASISQDAAAAKQAATEGVAAINTAVSNAQNNISSITSTAVSTANSAVNTANSAVTAANSAVTAVNSAVSAAQSTITTAKNNAVSEINTTTSTGLSNVNRVASEAVAQIQTSEAAAQETIDTGISQMMSYADDPNKVIYEYFGNNGNFRITALGSQGTYEEPNAVVYDYNDNTETLTFTPGD